MDTRLKKVKIEHNPTAIKEIDPETQQEKVYIQVDSVYNDAQYMESLIYNLVNKLDAFDYMSDTYNQQIANDTETYPQSLKYYIHLQYLLPGVFVYLSYLKYKRRLSLNTGGFTICLATLVNEFCRYKNISSTKKEKYQEYNEYSENYRFLMKQYIAGQPSKNIFKYCFGLDLDKIFSSDLKQQFLFKKSEYDNEGFILDQYFK